LAGFEVTPVGRFSTDPRGRAASRNKDQDEWEKIQKRYYRLAGLTKAKFLRSQASRDLLSTPTLTERIVDYMRCSGSAKEYVRFVRQILAHKEIECPAVTLNVRERLKPSSVTRLSLKLAQNEQTRSKSRKQKIALSCGWQRDLVDFSTR
jgi:hypothetical protein